MQHLLSEYGFFVTKGVEPKIQTLLYYHSPLSCFMHERGVFLSGDPIIKIQRPEDDGKTISLVFDSNSYNGFGDVWAITFTCHRPDFIIVKQVTAHWGKVMRNLMVFGQVGISWFVGLGLWGFALCGSEKAGRTPQKIEKKSRNDSLGNGQKRCLKTFQD